MISLDTLKESVDALGYTFHEFKNANDHRLHLLEKHHSVDPLLTEKIERLSTELDHLEEKVSTLNTKSSRPLKDGCHDLHDQHYQNAFIDYIRKGSSQPLETLQTKALSQDGGSNEGGFFVPAQLASRIHSVLHETSSLRNLARVTTITTNTLEILLDHTQTVVGWVGEKDLRPETKAPEVKKRTIPTHELYANPRATQRLLDDTAISLEEWLSEKIAHSMASHENEAFLTGGGVNKPTGFLHYPLTTANEWEWGTLEAVHTGSKGAFKAVRPEENLIDLFHSLKPAYMSQAVWLMSRSAQNEVRKLKDPNQNTYLWQPMCGLEKTPSLMGYPVQIMDAMPALSKNQCTSSIAFGNFFEGYQIVDRQETRILRDPYTYKPYVEFYATRRVGGDVVNFEAIKILRFDE